MSQKTSKYEFQAQAMLSQQLSSMIPEYAELAGSDPEISRSIAVLKVFGEHGILDMNDGGVKLLMDLLNAQRKAAFATSEKTNEITKMGMQMPRIQDIVGLDLDD